jgi:hypothetical protein
MCEQLRGHAQGGQSTNLDKGYCGSEAFREEILELLKQRLRGANNRNYQIRRQAHHHAEAQAMALIQSAKENTRS